MLPTCQPVPLYMSPVSLSHILTFLSKQRFHPLLRSLAQVQGLPAVLSGRDMIGIAFTGSGKTMVFALPMVVIALQEEVRMPLVAGEGPVGLIICPSRELARQTFDVVNEFAVALRDNQYGERWVCCLLPARPESPKSKEADTPTSIH